MNIRNKIIKSFFIVLLIMPLNSCGIWDPGDARKIDPSGEVRARKAIEEGRGISLDKALKGRGQGGAFQFASYSNEKCEIETVEVSMGSIIVFPSFLEHRVEPVTKGTRYSVVTWFTGPPFV